MSWTIHDDLRLSIRIGLTRGLALIRGKRRMLSPEERERVAAVIAEHLRRANWRIEPGPPLAGHGGNYDFRPRPPDEAGDG